MYILIKARLASKFELEGHYTLDEALKLHALWQMQKDMEAYQSAKLKKPAGGRGR